MINYDGTTTNGIKYIVALYSRNSRYQDIVDDLDTLKPARTQLLSGKGSVTQYSIGTRQLSRSNLSGKDLLALYDSLMKEKVNLEMARKPRRSVGVVLRDW